MSGHNGDQDKAVQQQDGAPKDTSTASRELVADKFRKMAAKNPRFREVKNFDKGVVIVGAKPK